MLISNERNDRLSPEVIATAPEVHREFYCQGQIPYRPINLRTLNNVDKDVLKALEIEHSEG